MRRAGFSVTVGLLLVGAFALLGLLAPLIAPSDPRMAVAPLTESLHGPSWHHLAGLDELSRDELSRLIFGARYSLGIGLVAVSLGLSAGLALGSVAGYAGGFVDSLLMRAMDVLLAIPGLLLAIGLVAVLGTGLVQIMVAVGVTSVPVFARLTRASVLAQREAEFALAARAIGVPRRLILVSHILPNAMSPVLVQATLSVGTAIIDVAGLGFLGLGPGDPRTPEWGTMLTGADRYLQSAPYLVIFPSIAIVALVFGFNLIGDGLREALDPRLRARD